MALSRDRRLAIVIGIYATTACVNALSNDWRFGYCLPSRFMLTALPALMIPLALTIDRALRQSIVLTFILVFGLCVGWDSNYQALVLTEGAYDGAHLIYRALDEMYPAGIHLPLLKDVATVPWLDVGAWAAGVAILVSLGRFDNRKLALLLAGFIAIVPVLASPGHADRLKTQVAPGLCRFSSRKEDVEVRSFRLQRPGVFLDTPLTYSRSKRRVHHEQGYQGIGWGGASESERRPSRSKRDFAGSFLREEEGRSRITCDAWREPRQRLSRSGSNGG